jgi:5-methyltetrahydrofolate--homocysteine methyltransferase
MANLQDLYDAILNGSQKKAIAVTEEALKEGVDAQKMVQEYMIPAMDEVGRRFETNEYFVPELLIAARAMKSSLALLRPKLASAGVKAPGRVAIGTVKGDLHDIGKNLVAAMLEGGGFEIVDLGVDVSPERFIAAVKDQGANVIALSALLTTTMPSMKTTIDALKAAGMRDQVKVIIGGAPVTQQYADEIGADAFGENASQSVAKVRSLLKV